MTDEPVVYGTPEAVAALFAALAAAAAACEWVQKRQVQGVAYRYATAESIVAEADRVLCDAGLAIVPGRCQVEQRSYAKDKAERTVLVLTREYLVVHRGGAMLVGGGVAALGANVGGTPPQAMNSAETMCFAYFVKTLLRMPRQDEEDPDWKRPGGDRTEQPTQPARPALAPSTTTDRKAVAVLAAIARAKDLDQLAKIKERFDHATSLRGAPLGDGEIETCGYDDDEMAKIRAAGEARAKELGA